MMRAVPTVPRTYRPPAVAGIQVCDLASAVATRCPALRADSGPSDFLEYRQWALEVAAQLERSVAFRRSSGRGHGPLRPSTVRVTAEGRVLLPKPTTRQQPDAATERREIGRLKLHLFAPLTRLLELDTRKQEDLLTTAQISYALADEFVDALRTDLAGPVRAADHSRLAGVVDATVRDWPTSSEEGLLALQVMTGRFLADSADFSLASQVWPGEPGLSYNGWGLAHGAAGVLHVLDVCSLDVDLQALRWLEEAVDLGRPLPSHRPGLYDGLAGVGWLHRRQGSDALADRILAAVRASDTARLGGDLHGGLAGIGLYLLSESEREPALLDDADLIGRRLREPGALPERAGLMWGGSGVALFALRLYQRTGDPGHLRLAQVALGRDLASSRYASDGALRVIQPDGGMALDLACGSAGVGLTILEALPWMPDPEPYLIALDGYRTAACTPLIMESGLYYGRAGIVHFLTGLARAGLSTTSSDAARAAHVDAFRLPALRRGTGIGFPSRDLRRPACDLATGAAGVLSALQAYGMLAFDDTRDGWDDLLPLRPG
ncbi:MAG: lanthionine synthetase C family protein, partial [Propionibacteriaceae bacterium]|nr:lanthionine synthetase C family protein [Propionibacteriaceae bacterium]